LNEELKDLIRNFNTIPFLFVGSGITRRYYGLPNWEGLLRIFASRMGDDEYIYNSYVSKVQDKKDYPMIAELIEKDFKQRWFDDKNFRNLSDNYLSFIEENVSPFKVEIASYVENNSIVLPQYKTEIDKFRELTKKSISGIITTNYDCFLENHTDRYTTYIGQEELVSSNIQGIAEIYKIHGCITNPDSIVINKTDYEEFEAKSQYLAAKLMTIFLEYPIIFVGYSITDENIQKILKAIVDCLSDKNISKLRNRFIFVEYSENDNIIDISSLLKEVGGKNILMTKVTLKNFEILYDLLLEKKPSIPVRVLRFLKDELYNYTITNEPTSNLKLASIDDKRVDDGDLALAIGTVSEITSVGLKGIDSADWYRNIILEDLNCSIDDLLEVTAPILIKQDDKLPLHKYLSIAKHNHLYWEQSASKNNFDNIISNTIRKDRHKRIKSERTVLSIWNDINIIDNLTKRLSLIAHLEENEINIDDLERILFDIFSKEPNILSTIYSTDVRRLIRIYDYLKFGKK